MLLALIALDAAGQPEPQARFMLAKSGRSSAQIVVSDAACDVIASAANELQLHIEKVTGVRISIVSENQLEDHRAPLIFVGESGLTEGLGLDPSKFRFEEFTIRIDARRIVLLGRDDPDAAAFTHNHRKLRREAGTLLAVYTFLKDYLGVRWYHPGELGTVIPDRKTVLLDPIEKTMRPRFSPRETVLRCGPGLDVTDDNFQKWARRTRHGGMRIGMGHNFGNVVGREFVKTNPEYFAVDRKGNRAFHKVRSKNLVHGCLSQPGLVDVFVEAARKYYDASPSNRCFTVMPGDSFQNYCCECAKCMPQYDFDSPDIPKLMQESRYVWGFVNRVAARLKDDYPNRLVFCCAYSRYRLPYPGLRYEPNVAIGVTVNRVGFGYQLGEAVEQGRQWIGVVDHILFDENYHHGAIEAGSGGVFVWRGAPRLCPRRIAASIKMRAPFAEGDPYDLYVPRETIDGKPVRVYRMWMMDNLNLYVTAEMNFDPSQDVETIISEYCRDLYGPAANQVKSFFDLLEKRWTETPARLGIHGYKETSAKLRSRMLEIAWTEIYPPDVIARLFAMLTQAKGRADDIYLDRVRLIEKTFLYMKERSEQYFKTAKPKEPEPTKPARWVVAPRIPDPRLTVDGKLDEAAWGQGGKGTDFFDVDKRQPASKRTTFRVLYDDDALYIGVTCIEPDMAKVSRNEYTRDGRCWDDNAVEVFLAREGKRAVWFQLVVNPAGSRYDAMNGDARWNPGRRLRMAAHLAADHWSAEMALPFTTLGARGEPRSGTKWKLKVCRTDDVSTPRAFTNWVLSLYHSPIAEYGDLWFGRRADRAKQ